MSQNNADIIQHPLQVISLLKRIQYSKQLISISSPLSSDSSLTTLLEVHHDTRHLVFDAPHPPLKSRYLEHEKELAFSLKLHHLPIAFKTRIFSHVAQPDHHTLVTRMPSEIHYPQSRDYFRLPTELIKKAKVSIVVSAKNYMAYPLVDLSLNGLCLRMPYSLLPTLKIGQYIPDLFLQLPRELGLSLSAEIRHIRTERNHTSLLVGLVFHEQPSRTERIIQRFIFRMESKRSAANA